jgi:hypothetical protein
MGMTGRHLSGREFPTSLAVHSDPYEGAMGADSMSAQNRTSFERGGGAFKSSSVTQGHLAGLSSQNRQTVVNWGDGPSSPSFPGSNS